MLSNSEVIDLLAFVRELGMLSKGFYKNHKKEAQKLSAKVHSTYRLLYQHMVDVEDICKRNVRIVDQILQLQKDAAATEPSELLIVIRRKKILQEIECSISCAKAASRQYNCLQYNIQRQQQSCWSLLHQRPFDEWPHYQSLYRLFQFRTIACGAFASFTLGYGAYTVLVGGMVLRAISEKAKASNLREYNNYRATQEPLKQLEFRIQDLTEHSSLDTNDSLDLFFKPNVFLETSVPSKREELALKLRENRHHFRLILWKAVENKSALQAAMQFHMYFDSSSIVTQRHMYM